MILKKDNLATINVQNCFDKILKIQVQFYIFELNQIKVRSNTDICLNFSPEVKYFKFINILSNIRLITTRKQDVCCYKMGLF